MIHYMDENFLSSACIIHIAIQSAKQMKKVFMNSDDERGNERNGDIEGAFLY